MLDKGSVDSKMLAICQFKKKSDIIASIAVQKGIENSKQNIFVFGGVNFVVGVFIVDVFTVVVFIGFVFVVAFSLWLSSSGLSWSWLS